MTCVGRSPLPCKQRSLGSIGESACNTVNCGPDAGHYSSVGVGLSLCEIFCKIDVENSGLLAGNTLVSAVALPQHVTDFQKRGLSNWPQHGFECCVGPIHSSPRWGVSGTSC